MAQRYRLIFSRRASSDLHSIFRYIERDSPQNATAMIQRLIDAIDSLEQFPHRYPIAQGVSNPRGPTRVMPVPPFLIYYRVLEPQEAVRIITIRHGARRPPHGLD